MSHIVAYVLLPAMTVLGGIALNEDDSHFYMQRPKEQMNLPGLQAWVDQYAGTKVSELFLCPNAQKTSYGSEVWDPIWQLDKKQNPPQDAISKAWVDNSRFLFEQHLDPYAIWISRCREKGISPWLSPRMNDVHYVNDTAAFIHSSFWINHPDYWRVPGGSGWTDRAFDYGIPEVREHHMKLLRELLERYDPDGLELDWMRFGWHFKPGKEAEGREILTQFMRDTRKLTQDWSKKRGHQIKLGARVPTLPDSARGLGMDGVAWAQEGLVDMLVMTPFWATSEYDIPMEQWRAQIGTTPVVLAAGAEILLRASPAANAIENDLESIRGFAVAHLYRGADQIYLFNYMDPAPMRGGPEAYRKLLKQGLDIETLYKQPRKYIVTYRDTVAPGMSNDAVLPAKCKQPVKFKIYIGPKPESGAASLVLGFSKTDAITPEGMSVSANGNKAASAKDYAAVSEFPGAVRAMEFTWPANQLVAGYNQLQVGQDEKLPDQEIVWAELRIQP